MSLTGLWSKSSTPEQGATGADGNARLTGAVGIVLLVILFVEGITILRVRQLITLHIFIGLVLIGPALLKLASTFYRFVRYYTSSPNYVRHGPPPLLLRWTAPLLIIVTVVLLGTGVALLAVAPSRPGLILKAHQASFVIWFALMVVHVLGHIKEAVVLSRWDWWPGADRARPRGKGQRRGLVALSLVAGFVLALALLPVASPWTSRPIRRDHHDASSQLVRPGTTARSSSWP
jgi:hypothetical protein